MKLKIGKPLNKQLHKDLYKLDIRWMEGDADGYEHTIIHFTKEEYSQPEFSKELELFVGALEKALKKDGFGRGGYDNYIEMMDEWYGDPNLTRFFYNYNENIEDEKNIIEISPIVKLMSYFPSEQHGFYLSFDRVMITYFDENGTEYAVKEINRR